MRIALLTFAVPWDACPVNGLYNIAQARALTEQGAETRIFSVAPSLPSVLASLGGPFRRQIERPASYTFEGVRVQTVRARAAYPGVVRNRVVPRWPRLASSVFSHLVSNALAAEFDAYKPHALLVHGMQPWGEFAANYALERGTKLIFIEHSLGDTMRIQAGSPLHSFVRRIGSRADATLAVNQDLTDKLAWLGVPRTAHLRNGVNTIEPNRTENLASTPGKNSPFTILCAGGYYPRKGHRELIDGFARAKLPDAELVLVGDPPAPIRREIMLRGLGEQTRILPLMPNDELLAEMARADLFALPSWSEAFGLVFMEALGVGTPVLMTSDCGAAKHLTHRKHGWIVPPRDPGAIALALQAAFKESPEKRSQMGQAGKQLVHDKFSWEQNARAVIKTITQPSQIRASDAPFYARRRVGF